MTTRTEPAPTTTGGSDWRTRLRESRLGTVVVLGVTAALVLGGAYLVSDGTDAAEDGVSRVELLGQTGPPPEVGAPAHDFRAVTTDGRQVALSDYEGRPVWLVFNATWCSSCRAEAPDIQQAHLDHDDVTVLSVYISESDRTVEGYAERAGLTFDHIADPQTTIASAYRVLGIPAHFFIDAEGVVRSSAVGSLSRAQMDRALAEVSG